MTSAPHPVMEESFDDAFEQLQQLYRADKLLHCARLLRDLRSRLDSLRTAGDDKHANALEDKLSSPQFRQLQAECAQTLELRQALDEQRDWTLSYDGTETKVWYRSEQSASTHSIKIHGTIRAPLMNIAALLYESDLYHNLFWYILSSNIIPVDHESDLKRAIHLSAYAPFPLYNRDVAIFAFVADALDDTDNCVLVLSRSIQETDPVSSVPDVSDRVVRAHMYNSGFELEPVEPHVTRARFLYNFDPKMRYVPASVLNWVSRTFCRWSLRVLEARARQLDKFSPEYGERLARKAVYDRIRRRLSEYWEMKGVAFDPKGEMRVSLESAAGSERDFDVEAVPEVPNSIFRSLLPVMGGGADADDDQQPSLRKKLSSKIFGTRFSSLR